MRFIIPLDLVVLHPVSKVVKNKECNRSRVGYGFLGMVLIWFITLNLEEECNQPSYSMVVYDRVFI